MPDTFTVVLRVYCVSVGRTICGGKLIVTMSEIPSPFESESVTVISALEGTMIISTMIKIILPDVGTVRVNVGDRVVPPGKSITLTKVTLSPIETLWLPGNDGKLEVEPTDPVTTGLGVVNVRVDDDWSI